MTQERLGVLSRQEVVQVSYEIEARKKAAEKGWLGEPQPERERQWGIWARMAMARQKAAKEDERNTEGVAPAPG